MVSRKFTKRSLITVACLLLILAPVNPIMTSAQTSPAVPQSSAAKTGSGVKKPNPVRRFFSWFVDGVTGVFKRPRPFYCILPPFVNVTSSNSVITFCPTTGTYSSREVSLFADAGDPESVEWLFTWNVTGGRLSGNGEGRNVTWDVSGLPEGFYTATVEMNDGKQHTSSASATVRIALSLTCDKPPPPCPTISVSYPNDSNLARPITFEATVTGGDPEMKPTYTWSISAGKIISGQGTARLTVDGSNLAGQSLTATVSLGGADPSCPVTASCTLPLNDDIARAAGRHSFASKVLLIHTGL